MADVTCVQCRELWPHISEHTSLAYHEALAKLPPPKITTDHERRVS